MRYWLVKTEPGIYSIEDLARDKVTQWDGIRNYQARNFLKDMEKGDMVMVYHSQTEPIGIAGLAIVAKEAYVDKTQFDKKSPYYDPASDKENPRWFAPDLKFGAKFADVLSLKEIRGKKELKDLVLLQKGSRLSVQPLTRDQFETLKKMSSRDA